MLTKIRLHFRLFILLALILANSFIWYFALSSNRHGLLTVAFMNIGQGDAIFIEAPNGNQVVFDGGPDSSIMHELPKLMSFYDRSLDMLVVTNPDKDHFAGFLDVLKNYSVGAVLEPGTHSDTTYYADLEKSIHEKKIPEYLARRGEKIWLDKADGVYISILFPDRDVSSWTSNDGSIVAKLVYGNTSVALQGDSTARIEDYLIKLDQEAGTSTLHADILKAGHHGSRTSTTPEYVAAVSPTYAVISAGLNNKFGHPHPETITTLENAHVQILKTFEKGTIVFHSDGNHLVLQ